LFLVLLLHFIGVPSSTDATTASLRLFLGQNGITYLKDVIVPILIQKIGTVSIPTISGSIGTPIGNIDYTLSSIQLSGLQIPTSAIAISSNGFEITADNVAASMTMNWHYEEAAWPHISDSGSADISVSSTTLAVGADLSGLSNGRPTFSVSSDSVSIGNLDITLHGGASWLYQLFVDAFSSDIKSSAESALQTELTSQLGSIVSGLIATIPISEQISNLPVEINFEFVQPLAFTTNSYLSTQNLGEFYYIPHPQEAPFNLTSIPEQVPQRMVTMAVSTYMIESGLFSFYEANYLHYLILPSVVPSDSPIKLNTSDFCDFVSGLCKAYPNQLMSIFANASSVPIFSITQAGPSGIIQGDLAFSTYPTGKPLFTLGAHIIVNGNVSIVGGNKITGALTYLKSVLSVVSSEVGTVRVGLLQFAVDYMLSKVLIPHINKLLENGFPIPVFDGITFVSPTISYGTEFVVVSTDISYNPSLSTLKLLSS